MAGRHSVAFAASAAAAYHLDNLGDTRKQNGGCIAGACSAGSCDTALASSRPYHR
jgi:hypothetical protein